MKCLVHRRLSAWLVVAVLPSLGACTSVYYPPEGWARADRHGLYSKNEGHGQFRPDLIDCVSQYDAPQLPTLKNGGDYPMTGWFVPRDRVVPVRTCLVRKGWQPYQL